MQQCSWFLPGDDLYPVVPDMDGVLPQLSLPYSLQNAQANSRRHNRMILQDDGTLYVHCTITQKYNHVSPAASSNWSTADQFISYLLLYIIPNYRFYNKISTLKVKADLHVCIVLVTDEHHVCIFRYFYTILLRNKANIYRLLCCQKVCCISGDLPKLVWEC